MYVSAPRHIPGYLGQTRDPALSARMDEASRVRQAKTRATYTVAGITGLILAGWLMFRGGPLGRGTAAVIGAGLGGAGILWATQNQHLGPEGYGYTALGAAAGGAGAWYVAKKVMR